MKRPKLEILESDDIRKIVTAAYDLLENFGVMVNNEEALGFLEDSGARVDVKDKVAYIPAGMVDTALETRPSGIVIYDQEGKKSAVLENDNIHFCPGSVALNILDSETEKIRKPTLQDFIRIVSLAQTLEHVQFITGPLVLADIPQPLLDAYRYYLLMLNTSKPLFAGAFTVDGLRFQLEMLSVLRGGEDELRAKPRAIFANCQSPEKLVVGNNICGAALRFIKGVACNEETIAMEVIKSAGRDAQEYLSSGHTMKWFKKELFFPTDIIHRRSIREGEKEDSAWERAKAEVTERLDRFTPVSLSEDKIKEIMRIMKSYAGTKRVDILPQVDGWLG